MNLHKTQFNFGIQDESRDRQGTDPGVAGGLGSSVGGNRIVERAHRGIRSADRANRPASVSRSCSASTSEGSRNPDCVDLRSNLGRSTPLSPQPGCRMFSGVACWAPELWQERTTTPHQQGAHYILGPFGQDSDLRRWGLKLAERGGKNAKKRAVVAVARKLAVLLHKLWVSGEVYEPLRNNHKVMNAVA